jgi:hypothetical protein
MPGWLLVSLLGRLVLGAPLVYPWLPDAGPRETLEQRVPPPPGYTRLEMPEGSFGAWLRALPLRPPGARVHLYDGREKRFQAGAFAVLDLDVGTRDLQQCADAVIRLRAEWLWAAGRAHEVAFNFTSGHRARWSDWAAGKRPVVEGAKVTWEGRGQPASSHAAFRAYLDTVFTYAGSASLERELVPVADPALVEPGDVFIRGGHPGHAVLVVDVARDAAGARVFLLVQSYLPAQEVHLLVNPGSPGTPWYPALRQGQLITPEWVFEREVLRRFR